MKRLYYFLVALLLIVAYSCKKDIEEVNPPGGEEPPPSDQTYVNPHFDWKMSHDVVFYLKNTQGKYIKISSVDGEKTYLKATGIEETFETTIVMAKIVTEVAINGNIVPINNGTVNYELPADYKSVATAQWALDFDEGTTDYISCGNPNAPDVYIPDYPFTIEAWIKTSSFPGGDMVIASFWDANEDDVQFGLFIGDSEAGKAVVWGSNGTQTVLGKGGSDLRDDKWHHVAGVFMVDKYKLYVDGVLKETTSESISYNLGDLNNFSIGYWGENTNDKSYFDGVIDEVRLWNTERSQGQISYNRTRSVDPSSAGLVGYWDMEEGSGITTADKTGHGLTGQFFGSGSPVGPTWVGNIDSDSDGAPNMQGGDVWDEYPHDPDRAFNNYWPASPWTLAFEDLWPSMGDYDLNDQVIEYQFNRVTNTSNELVEAFCNFELMANGAALGSGFGFSLPNSNIPSANINVTGYDDDEGYINYNANGTEVGQTYITIIPDDKLPSIGNTYQGNWNGTRTFSVTISITQGGPYVVSSFDFQHWNPFLIVGVGFPGFERMREIHLAGYVPTLLAEDEKYFDSINDGSDYPSGGVGGDLWYKTNAYTALWGVDSLGQYFPWGLDIPKSWEWPIEADSVHEPAATPDPSNGYYRFTIKYAYDKFWEWAYTDGTNQTDWYNNPGYTDFIYQSP